MSNSPYEDYLRDEWLLFAGDTVRQQEARLSAAGVTVQRVLDVGCGGGQDLIPFAAPETTCVGVDVSQATCVWATRRFAATYPHLVVRFTTAAAEDLPFANSTFDVVLCRVAIPYTDNRRALAEMGRVLRPGGVLVLKTHAPAYYFRKLLEGIRQRSPLFSIHALRVLLTGTIYHLTGRQPRGGVLLRETFLAERRLRIELERANLTIVGVTSDNNALTPCYRVIRRG
jgi:ubiquinone/menaquinone biosynthesis C-methylase UbiE